VPQIPVQLDDVQVLDALKERDGQRAQPGAYFDDMFAAPRIDCRNDPLDDSPFDEKVLTESFARNMPACRHCALAPRLRLRHPDRRLDRRKQALGLRAAGAGELERGAVVDRSGG